MVREEIRLKEYIRFVDVVLEVLDARLPLKSRNYRLQKMLGEKNRLVVLNKADLADKEITGRWLEILAGKGWPVLAFDAKKAFALKKMEKILLVSRPQNLRYKRPIRLMAVGIPNVGKSTLINRLARRFAVKTGERAGITRGPQWIKMRGGWEMLDTPGLLPPRWRDNTGAFALAVIGALDSKVVDAVSTAKWLLAQFLLQEKTARTLGHYYLQGETEKEQGAAAMLLAIGLSRGCIKRGGQIDQEKAAQMILRDFRRGVLGPLSLEKPEDYADL
ncbi:MAG: ribosome biogenesis GTPase YlqF [Dethiobacteria bacterium]|jgi:ribosome biogenesis GTPase A